MASLHGIEKKKKGGKYASWSDNYAVIGETHLNIILITNTVPLQRVVLLSKLENNKQERLQNLLRKREISCHLEIDEKNKMKTV